MNEKLKNFSDHDKILIKSHFYETTRKGALVDSMILGLTPLCLQVNHMQIHELKTEEKSYRLADVKLSIFKNSRRQCLKVCFYNLTTKYFELGKLEKRKIIWCLWCNHVTQLSRQTKLWPFINLECDNDNFNNYSTNKRKRWTDKYLYLGTARELEDSNRPQPIPGLALFDKNNKELFYLKPEYFGCWDQSEHWVQCENSSFEFITSN